VPAPTDEPFPRGRGRGRALRDIGTSGQEGIDGGTGKSTAEMELLATFRDILTAGLDAEC
jgi:hypothetical protein